MMFQLGSLFGIILGYFLCYGHAKLTLAIHRHSPEGRREETDRLNAEWVANHPPTQPQPAVTDTAVLPSSFHGDGRPLSEQWNLPHRRSKAVQDDSDAMPPVRPGHRIRKKYPDAPVEYFSAKQVLATLDDRGFPIDKPQYPGGLHGWYRDHGWPYDSEKAEDYA